ncbi:SNF2 domain-containing protein [Murinocardiopsis flavida]|uniref:SNF2 domain-containing protein n=1 Tax=Murinocardiopsis flavida TaxID=645275 RepID=A0A2P8DPA1_9ACTN|nr:SNF2 domain-containing protein [Murinocardiopsis flavida]
MVETGQDNPQADPYAPGARIEVRDTEWMVRTCTRAHDFDEDGWVIRASGVSELVREEDAVFFTGIDEVRPLRPEDTRLVPDLSDRFTTSRLFLESVLRRTPLPQTERRLAMSDAFLLDRKVYQQRPAELALRGLRPRILIADVVGLGKTLEIGLILAELIRRGRGERILVVTPQQVLEQFQRELWTRFAIPLVRLDSVGLERVQREIPAGRNPFLYFKRAIISVDTLKNQGKYGQHLRNTSWDAVVIDESHNLINQGNLRNKLARLLARHTDALLLASATPHNGDTRSFAELIRLLDPAAIADPDRYSPPDISHLYIRRTKANDEVRDQMGEEWPERGPSRPVNCAASDAEERVFAELAGTWLGAAPLDGGPVVTKERRLFPYTLVKAFLSSHKALETTVEARLTALTGPDGGTLKDPARHKEHAALLRLKETAKGVGDDDSAKRAALIAKLREIGVGPRSPERVVVFSESRPTLKWLRATVPGALGMTEAETALLHGELPDTMQQQVLADFELADSKVRIFFTSDIASEGVNLHQQCHQLIHYDLPWSMIRIEQRNGRIDRYGQEHQPQFSALVLTSETEGAFDDRTVAEKLLEREDAAHRSIGSVEAVIGEYTAKSEEDRLLRDLLAGRTVEESVASAEAAEEAAVEVASMAGFFGDSDPQDDLPEPEYAPVPRLFSSTEEFVLTGLPVVAPETEVNFEDGMLAFAPPEDLAHRFKALPASYLKERAVTARLKVTFDRHLAAEKRDEARTTRSAWPEIGYASDLHPLVEWLVDKLQVRLHRSQAPVIRADVPSPVFLVQGVYSNELGQPTVVEWMAVTGLPDAPRVGDMFEVVRAAGIGPGMINTGAPGDLAALQELVGPAVDAARVHLDAQRAVYDAQIERDLRAPEERLADFEQMALDGLGEDWRRANRRGEVDATVAEQQQLMRKMRTMGEPLLRILAVVKGA